MRALRMISERTRIYGDDCGISGVITEQVVNFSNASLVTHAGLFVGTNATCTASPTNNTAVMQFPTLGSKVGRPVAVGFQISGSTLTIACDPAGGAVHVNADASNCFVFSGSAPFLPATPIELNCSSSGRK